MSGGQIGCNPCRKSLCARDRAGRPLDSVDIESIPQKVDEAPPLSTACIEHTHTRREAPLQKLVEKIDVDVAERLVQREGRGCHCCLLLAISYLLFVKEPAVGVGDRYGFPPT